MCIYPERKNKKEREKTARERGANLVPTETGEDLSNEGTNDHKDPEENQEDVEHPSQVRVAALSLGRYPPQLRGGGERFKYNTPTCSV